MSEVVLRRRKRTSRRSEAPVTTMWNDARMVRTHSIRAACHEILHMSKMRDLIKINIIGDPGSGKSTLAEVMAHIIHAESKVPYTVRIFDKNDLMNLREVIEGLSPTNYIMIFDDVSFINAEASSRTIKKIESTLTEIRHLPGRKDVKVILFLDFHYTMAVPKYMRQANINIYTTIGTSDVDNAVRLVGGKHASRVYDFIRISDEVLIPPETFTIKLGRSKFVYDYKKPFVPALFYNKRSPRLIVFPHREKWLAPMCPVCNDAKKKEVRDIKTMEEFDSAIRSKFGPGLVKRAMRLKLYINGLSTLDKHMSAAMRFIDRYAEKNSLSLTQMADFYGLYPVKAWPQMKEILDES